jgi:hypothetical protein
MKILKEEAITYYNNEKQLLLYKHTEAMIL